jgi:4'-phosphopantetheinyl transferase EntD
MIAEILPSVVASSEVLGDRSDAARFPEKEPVVASASERRRRAFNTGRACARRALADMGLRCVEIPSEEDGTPRWPGGVVGSITHCAGYCTAVAGWASEVLCVGIDAEPNRALPEKVLRRTVMDHERAWLPDLIGTDSAVSWDRLLFSAKESAFKAWYPLTRIWLEFTEVVITFDLTHQTFDSRLPASATAGACISRFTGRWLASDELVVTAIAVTT